MAGGLGFILDAAAVSALYALIAIGFTLIFGVGNVLNFAHGAFITVGAFVAYLVSNPAQQGLSPWLGLAVAMLLVAALGGLSYRGIVHYIQDRPVTVIITTLVGGFFLQHALRVFVTPASITVPLPVQGSLDLGNLSVPSEGLFIFASAWVLIGLIVGFVKYTRPGQAILATSMSRKGARVVGIAPDRINLYTWITGAALAGFAGVLLAGFPSGSWDMGTTPLVISLAIVVLGGLGSIRGSIVGAYVIGFLEEAMTQFVHAEATGLVALLVLVVVILVRPGGLYGSEVEA